TGAGGSIGAAICRRLDADGRVVAALDADFAAAKRVTSGLSAKRAVAIRCDVTRFDEAESAIDRVRRELGEPDLLVNNAGILGPPSTGLVDLDPKDWEQVFAVNITGAWNVIRAVVPGMAARRRGCVVNVASGAAYNGVPGIGAYGASKAAL